MHQCESAPARAEPPQALRLFKTDDHAGDILGSAAAPPFLCAARDQRPEFFCALRKSSAPIPLGPCNLSPDSDSTSMALSFRLMGSCLRLAPHPYETARPPLASLG